MTAPNTINRQSIETELRRLMPALRAKFGVTQIGLFGSFVRDEGVAASDIDLLVEFPEPIGWEFIDLKDFLERALGREVDLVTKAALKPQLRDRILAEVAHA